MKEVRLSLFADEIIWCIEYPRDITRKPLELISEFSKVAEYKTNTQKSVPFPNTNYELSGKEIKEIIPFTIASKRIRCLEISIPKEGKRPVLWKL